MARRKRVSFFDLGVPESQEQQFDEQVEKPPNPAPPPKPIVYGAASAQYPPLVGETWQNIHTQTLGIVVKINQPDRPKAKPTVTVNAAGTEKVIDLGMFQTDWKRKAKVSPWFLNIGLEIKCESAKCTTSKNSILPNALSAAKHSKARKKTGRGSSATSSTAKKSSGKRKAT